MLLQIINAKLISYSKHKNNIFLRSWYLPFSLCLCLCLLSLLLLLISIGCHNFNSTIFKTVSDILLIPIVIGSFLSTISIIAASIVQFRNKLIAKGVTNLVLFLISLLLVVGNSGILYAITMAGASLCYATPVNKKLAISTALEWTRLSPLPSSAKNIETKISGSAFTREYIVVFNAPAKDIERWLLSSAGIENVVPKELVNGYIEYQIKTIENVSYGKLIVDKSKRKVYIRAVWS